MASGKDCAATPNKTDIPDKPNWIRDVHPILLQHARKYRFQKSAQDMADYSHWVKNKNRYCAWLTKEREKGEPCRKFGFLTELQKSIIFKWLTTCVDDKPVLLEIDTVADLQCALQTAVLLEFATLPPYLTAMFSLQNANKGPNGDIYSTLYNIVIQEMAHFALACNMLLATGGKPVINNPDVIPSYPGPLPGGLRPDTVVNLTKLTTTQLNTFMSIESPDVLRVVSSTGCVDESSAKTYPSKTIGEFYETIIEGFINLNSQLPYGNQDLQTTHLSSSGVRKITKLDDAKYAINLIVLEGEGGGSPDNPNPGLDPYDGDDDKELAHYYKYAQIYYGNAIVVKEDRMGFCYSGDAITVNTSGVYDFPDNPEISRLDPTSPEYGDAVKFATTYQSLLDNLQKGFTEDQSYIKTAISDMRSLSSDAQPLMQEGVGTPFELPPSSK